MGEVRKYSRRRSWTKEEERILLRDYERKSVSEIAKKLNRSESSIHCKRKRMGLYCFRESTDKLNTCQVAEIIGISQSGVSHTWMRKGLKFQKVGGYKVVTEETLVKFMQEHPELWKASKCDYYFFCRYKWFKDRLQRENAGIEKYDHYKDLRRWTDKDISRVRMLMKRGFSNKEIAEEIGRTKYATDHVCRRLRKEKAE